MSMLGSQIEELRRKADELRLVHADDTSAGTLFAAMGAMREAADTIESLRDRLETVSETSDGYHTFNELYHHRAVLFSVVVRDNREHAWKARKHHDGTMYDGMFIVGIDTTDGQATYHYDLDPYWDMFDCEEREFAPEWDGHTPDDAIARIAALGSGTCGNLSDDSCWFECSSCKCTCSIDYWGDGFGLPRFCPNCGRRVKGGAE